MPAWLTPAVPVQNTEQAAGLRQPRRRRIRFNGNQGADDAAPTISSPQKEPTAPSTDGVLTGVVPAITSTPSTPEQGSAEQATVNAATTSTAAGMFFGGLKPMQGVRYCFVGFSEHDRVCTLLPFGYRYAYRCRLDQI